MHIRPAVEDFRRIGADDLSDQVPEAATNVVAIAAGWGHSLALRRDGSVVAWGDNGYRQMEVPSFATNVVAIAAGFYHSAALLVDGTVVSWGRNAFGVVRDSSSLTNAALLGVGEDFSIVVRGVAEPFFGKGRATITAGKGHPLVLRIPVMTPPGSAFQWFWNGVPIDGATNQTLVFTSKENPKAGGYSLRIESGGINTESVPIQVVLEDQPTSVVVAGGWGDNHYDQSRMPAGLASIRAVSAGSYHSLALQSDGRVAAWGKKRDGQTNVPMNLTNAVAIAAGGDHCVALTAGGQVVAWGRDWDGQSTPLKTQRRVVAIEAGWSHSLALEEGGTVVAWGSNEYGQTNVPPSLSEVVEISAGYYHSLALRADGTVVSWGEAIPPPTNLSPVVAIAAGWSHSLAITKDGGIVAWGDDDYGAQDIPLSATNVIAISAGYGFSLALREDGTVIAWGKNFALESIVPVGLGNVSAVSAGEDFALAMIEEGPPRIVREAFSPKVAVGKPVFLRFTASGTRPLRYQWFHDGLPIPGQTNSVLFIDKAMPTDAGVYSAAAENDLGQTTTQKASLTFVPSGQFVLPRLGISMSNQSSGTLLTLDVFGAEGAEMAIDTSFDLGQWTEIRTIRGAGAENAVWFVVTPVDEYQFWRVRLR